MRAVPYRQMKRCSFVPLMFSLNNNNNNKKYIKGRETTEQ